MLQSLSSVLLVAATFVLDALVWANGRYSPEALLFMAALNLLFVGAALVLQELERGAIPAFAGIALLVAIGLGYI